MHSLSIQNLAKNSSSVIYYSSFFGIDKSDFIEKNILSRH